MLNDNKNPYLAKWLANELKPEELKELKKLPEFEEYEKIVKGVEYFKVPDFDTQKSLTATLEKLQQPKKGKVISLKPVLYAVAAAASVLLVLGFLFNTVTYTANSAQKLAITLPDGSNVDINAGSSLSHQRFFWSLDRKVNLEGEAYFQVTSGNTFSVNTSLGKVAVLGTKFNVKGRNETFEVSCYEGKVQVSANEQQLALTKNEATALQNNMLEKTENKDENPSWISGKSVFESVALEEVLDELERQFDVNFVRNGIDQTKLFSGGFVHNDLETALQAVLIPMGIQYQVLNKTITLEP